MNQQPEALRLADEADDWRTDHTERGEHIRETAAELRRQHAEIEALRRVGNQLAAFAFNLAQWPGRVLKAREAELLDDLRKQWDAAREVKP